jgi:hypothetical protein
MAPKTRNFAPCSRFGFIARFYSPHLLPRAGGYDGGMLAIQCVSPRLVMFVEYVIAIGLPLALWVAIGLILRRWRR